MAGIIVATTGLTALADSGVEEIINDQIIVDQRYPQGWVKKEGNTYNYIDVDGQKAVGWKKVDNQWYYFDENGSMTRGWKNIGGQTYYFFPGGSMARGFQKIEGSTYYFWQGGSMAKGIVNMKGLTYVYSEDGKFLGKGKKYISNASAYTGHSITSTGQRPYWGSIAVDPRVIPYGSKVYVPYYNKVFVANDCGGAIKGTKIDIFMKSSRNAMNFGRRNIPIIVFQ